MAKELCGWRFGNISVHSLPSSEPAFWKKVFCFEGKTVDLAWIFRKVWFKFNLLRPGKRLLFLPALNVKEVCGPHDLYVVELNFGWGEIGPCVWGTEGPWKISVDWRRCWHISKERSLISQKPRKWYFLWLCLGWRHTNLLELLRPSPVDVASGEWLLNSPYRKLSFWPQRNRPIQVHTYGGKMSHLTQADLIMPNFVLEERPTF